jgi:hypothetical protein
MGSISGRGLRRDRGRGVCMMMTTIVIGSRVSLCAGFSLSVSFVFCRIGLEEFTIVEFLGERKSGGAGEKKKANNDTRAPDKGWPVCEGAVKSTPFRPSGGKCAAPWYRRNGSQVCFQIPCRIPQKFRCDKNISAARCRLKNHLIVKNMETARSKRAETIKDQSFATIRQMPDPLAAQRSEIGRQTSDIGFQPFRFSTCVRVSG